MKMAGLVAMAVFGTACILSADEVDDALAVETEEQSVISAQPSSDTPAAPVNRDAEERIAFLKDLIERKDAQLAEAVKEIARLKTELDAVAAPSQGEMAVLRYNMGCVYRTAGMYEKAEAKFLEALEFNPDSADVHFNLGILYEENLKDFKKARRHYERFLELAPDDPDALKVEEWLRGLDKPLLNP